MKIKVTRKHIEDGETGTSSCPIALAILDQLPDAEVSVDANEISVDCEKGCFRIDTPGKIQEFIRAHDPYKDAKEDILVEDKKTLAKDFKKTCKPFSFEIWFGGIKL